MWNSVATSCIPYLPGSEVMIRFFFHEEEVQSQHCTYNLINTENCTVLNTHTHTQLLSPITFLFSLVIQFNLVVIDISSFERKKENGSRECMSPMRARCLLFF